MHSQYNSWVDVMKGYLIPGIIKINFFMFWIAKFPFHTQQNYTTEGWNHVGDIFSYAHLKKFNEHDPFYRILIREHKFMRIHSQDTNTKNIETTQIHW